MKCFIHIPKCAGLYIRSKLETYDDTDGAFSSRVEPHPELGVLDYVHIPLFTLRDYFPQEYAKVAEYWSFSVVRDPYKRFPSSLTQLFRMYADERIEEKSTREIRAKVDEVIDFLSGMSGKNSRLPAEYVHFQRQVDYVYVDGERIVDTAVPIDRFDVLETAFYQHTGLVMNLGREDSKVNQQIPVMRNDFLKQAIESVRPYTGLLTKIIPEHTKEKIRAYIYVPRDRRFNAIFESDYVKDFIKDYYRDDIRMFEEETARLTR